MSERTIAAVVPTCRGFTIPEQTVPVHWYIVHDREQRPVEYNDPVNDKVTHIVAPDVAMYGERCDCIRSAGFLAAARDGHAYILTVDDDCTLPIDWAEAHRRALMRGVSLWTNTHPDVTVRGMPWFGEFLPVAISHGLWDGVPDLDGRRQAELEARKELYQRAGDGRWKPINAPFPQSAMNLGFVREVASVMYQPRQGPGTPFDRFADMWGGLFAQRCLTLHGYAFKNGGAIVHHRRASDTAKNIEKETPGLAVHDKLCKYVWRFDERGVTLSHTYMKLAEYLGQFPYVATNAQDGDYFLKISENMRAWAAAVGIFEETMQCHES